MHALVIGAQARQLGLYVELCLCPRHARSASIRSGMHALVIGAQARQLGLYVELCLSPRHACSAYDMRGMQAIVTESAGKTAEPLRGAMSLPTTVELDKLGCPRRAVVFPSQEDRESSQSLFDHLSRVVRGLVPPCPAYPLGDERAGRFQAVA